MVAATYPLEGDDVECVVPLLDHFEEVMIAPVESSEYLTENGIYKQLYQNYKMDKNTECYAN